MDDNGNRFGTRHIQQVALSPSVSTLSLASSYGPLRTVLWVVATILPGGENSLSSGLMAGRCSPLATMQQVCWMILTVYDSSGACPLGKGCGPGAFPFVEGRDGENVKYS